MTCPSISGSNWRTWSSVAAISGAAAGGGVGDNFVVMRYEDGTGGGGRVIEPASLGVMPGMPGSVAVTAHASALDAFRDTNAVDTEPQMAENAVMVVDGIVETGTSSTTVAEVATGFTKFVVPGGGAQSATLAAIGKLEIKTAMSVLARNGSPAATPSVLLNNTDPITVTYMGDFSEHTYTLNSAMTCATGDTVLESSVNSDKTELTLAAQPAGTDPVTQYLCVSVAEDNMMRITDAAFTATVKYAAVENAAFPRMEMTETVGMIERNGTTVHIPYLTTYDGYNQRIVLSNRGSAMADYLITFRPEMGVTATAKDAAEGTLEPMSTMTLRAVDLVMLEGGSRTAATVDVVGALNKIDVTSVIVNKDGGGYGHRGASFDDLMGPICFGGNTKEKGGLRPSLFSCAEHYEHASPCERGDPLRSPGRETAVGRLRPSCTSSPSASPCRLSPPLPHATGVSAEPLTVGSSQVVRLPWARQDGSNAAARRSEDGHRERPASH